MSEDFWIGLVAVGLFISCFYNLVLTYAIYMGHML